MLAAPRAPCGCSLQVRGASAKVDPHSLRRGALKLKFQIASNGREFVPETADHSVNTIGGEIDVSKERLCECGGTIARHGRAHSSTCSISFIL